MHRDKLIVVLKLTKKYGPVVHSTEHDKQYT